ncbi:MAG: toprim domain-containing protein [Hyphomonadaceae bacterium JAD_PAG50586_4]|nr:MAG: toprim domain-containing protein [Hyphomonadaceae bacterium JAD_PAG50586_4]
MSRLKRIVDAMGGQLMDGGRRALVRGPGHGPGDRSVSLLETEDGRVLIHCFSPRDDWRAVRDELADLGLLDEDGEHHPNAAPVAHVRALGTPDEDRRARVMRLWDESAPIPGAIAERYLRAREIEGELPGPDVLRFHPRMTSLDDRERRPALVAALVDADAVLQGIQVTLLSAHGATKAPVATPRRTIGRLMGNYVRVDAPSDTLVVAEGLETALSARRALGAGAWAFLSAENLAQFEPPRVIDRLIIAADRDEAGLFAAERLRARAIKTITVEIALPPEGFADWNDWARARAI